MLRPQNTFYSVRTWLSGKVKQGMQNSHGEVVAVTVGPPRTDVLWCIAAQGPLGAAHCAQNDIAHCAQQRWGPRVAVAPPRADAEVFAQPEHLSLSSIQPVHTADKHHAVQCTSVSKKRSLSTVLLLHLFHCCAQQQSKFTQRRRAQLLLGSCCSLAGGAQQLPCEQALLTPYF